MPVAAEYSLFFIDENPSSHLACTRRAAVDVHCVLQGGASVPTVIGVDDADQPETSGSDLTRQSGVGDVVLCFGESELFQRRYCVTFAAADGGSSITVG